MLSISFMYPQAVSLTRGRVIFIIYRILFAALVVFAAFRFLPERRGHPPGSGRLDTGRTRVTP